MAQRVKGQESSVVVIVDGQPSDSLNAIKDLEVSFQLERLQEGYLGETTDRYDDVFKGLKGSLTAHLDSPAAFNVVQQIVERARRRTPGIKFNIKTTLEFPSGRRARVVLRDVAFGEVPVNFGSRTDYVSLKLDFACSDGQVLVS